MEKEGVMGEVRGQAGIGKFEKRDEERKNWLPQKRGQETPITFRV